MLSFLASIILRIEKFFDNLIESFETFFDASEEYLSVNIKSGKIFYNLREAEKNTSKSASKHAKGMYKSALLQKFLWLFSSLLKVFLAVTIIKTFCEILNYMRIIYGRFAKYLILFLLFGVFPLNGLLLYLLFSSPSLFFICLIPIIIALLLIESILFSFIEKRENNEETSIAKSFLFSLHTLKSIIILFLFYILLCSSILILVILVFSFFIQSLNILASGSVLLFIYSLVALLLASLTLSAIFYLSILVSQAYFILLFEGEDPLLTLIRIGMSLRRNLLPILTYYAAIFLFFLTVLYLVFLYLSNMALVFILAFIVHFLFLFSYGVRRRFLIAHKTTIELPQKKESLFSFLFSIFFFVGIIGYTAFTSFVIQSYPKAFDLYAKWQFDRDIQKDFLQYVNNENAYSIFYPKEWRIYPWNNKSVTLYYNANNTASGSISVNIDVLPLSETNYFQLHYAESGAIIYNQARNEQITKVDNLFLDGYSAIKYTEIRTDPSLTEYKTIYLVLRGNDVYKISFVTVNSVLQKSYDRIFGLMIDTFKFIR